MALDLAPSMVVRLAESLHQLGRFDHSDLVLRYKNWHRGPPLDNESAFDTGPTFSRVFNALWKGKNLDEATQLVASSAGCNAAHRCPPLAMAAFLADGDELAQATRLSSAQHVES